MSKTMRRLVIAFAAVLMVMMMAVPTFADTTVNATVHFITYNTSTTVLTDVLDRQFTITPINVSVPVSFTYSDDNQFTSIIPGANETNHQYYHTPTVMDAIYSAYLTNNGSSTGWTSYWDTSSNPKGAYVTTIYGDPQVTTVLQNGYWEGYSWLLIYNTDAITGSWDSITQTGMLPYYGSNVILQNNDNIYVRYLHCSQSY